ncbi:MAG: hypothetical protein RSJ41_00120 [Clostridia bacterium]
MKKLAGFLLALVLVLGCAGAAFAQEVQEIPVDYEGDWVVFDEKFQLLVPSEFVDHEVTPEFEKVGIFAVYSDPDGSRTFSVQWIESAGTLDELAAAFAENALYSNVVTSTINGVPFVVYNMENAIGCACADGDDSGFYVFSFTPNDQPTSEFALQLMASFSAPGSEKQ